MLGGEGRVGLVNFGRIRRAEPDGVVWSALGNGPRPARRPSAFLSEIVRRTRKAARSKPNKSSGNAAANAENNPGRPHFRATALNSRHWTTTKNNHPNKIAILLLNIFLGWSFIGWVIALVWSFIKR